MSLTVKEIEKEALRLDPRERALLAEHLIGSLDPDEDPETERLWIEEAERRYKGYKEGRVKTKPAEMVMREAHEKFK
jgi:putative addiction module component (TIGR02574 family)